jgi:hypothetical protein
MGNYVLAVDLGDLAEAKQYVALDELMYEFGFTLRGSETLRPAQFSVISALPPSVITLKPAIRYQFKTGQRDWPKT